MGEFLKVRAGKDLPGDTEEGRELQGMSQDMARAHLERALSDLANNRCGALVVMGVTAEADSTHATRYGGIFSLSGQMVHFALVVADAARGIEQTVAALPDGPSEAVQRVMQAVRAGEI